MRRYARTFRLGRPFALLLRGRQDHIDGRVATAERRWRAAAAWAERLGTPYELAGANLSLGLQAGDREHGARYLRRAAELYDAMGAVRDLEVVEAALARTGGAR